MGKIIRKIAIATLPLPIRTVINKFIYWLQKKYRLLTFKKRVYPDFYIVGAQKSGTSSLYHWLKQHPEIIMSFDKESKFFDRHYNKGLNYYKYQFPTKKKAEHKMVGDNTPYYIFHPLVPKRIFEVTPNAKIIMILRNPIDRAYSQYQMEKRKKREPALSFKKAIEKEDERIEEAKELLLKNPLEYNHIFENTSYLNRGKYAEQIKNWLKYFNPNQILIIKSEDFYANPEGGLQSIYEFLKISDWKNTNLKPFNIYNDTYEELDKELRNELEKYYNPYEKDLKNIINQNFKHAFFN